MPSQPPGSADEAGSFAFVTTLWRHPGDDGWYFVSLPTEVADDIADLTAGARRGFGSVRVAVAVGGTSWSTSVFPDSKRGTYVLPVKRSVRVAEQLEEGDELAVRLQVVLGDETGARGSPG